MVSTPRLACSEESDHVMLVRRDRPVFTSPPASTTTTTATSPTPTGTPSSSDTVPRPPDGPIVAPAISMPCLIADVGTSCYRDGVGGDGADDGWDWRNATLPRVKAPSTKTHCSTGVGSTHTSTSCQALPRCQLHSASCSCSASSLNSLAPNSPHHHRDHAHHREAPPLFTRQFANRSDWMARLSKTARSSPMCKLKIPGLIVYVVQCTVYTVHCTLYTVHYKLYTVQCIVCNVYNAQCINITIIENIVWKKYN